MNTIDHARTPCKCRHHAPVVSGVTSLLHDWELMVRSHVKPENDRHDIIHALRALANPGCSHPTEVLFTGVELVSAGPYK